MALVSERCAASQRVMCTKVRSDILEGRTRALSELVTVEVTA